MKIRYLVDTTIRKPGLSAEQMRQLRLGGAPQSAYRVAVKKGEEREVDEDEAKSVIATGVAEAADEVAAKIPQPPQEQIDNQAKANAGMGAANPELNASSPIFQQEANAAIAVRLGHPDAVPPTAAAPAPQSLTESLTDLAKAG